MNIQKLNQIDTLALDEEKLKELIINLNESIIKIDTINHRFEYENNKNQLYSVIEERIYKYVLDIAEENKTKNEAEIKKFFYERVDNIYDFSIKLANKKGELEIEDINELHRIINPNGCWDILEKKDGRNIKKFSKSGKFRNEERFADDLGERYYYEKAENIEKYINILLDWYNKEDGTPEIIKILIFIIFSINIHPYSNSNGTTIFILFGILCLKSNYFIPLIIYQYFNSELYVKDVRKLKNDGDISDFIKNSLNAFLYYSE